MATILVLNLGSTSTKAAVFQDETALHSVTLRHSAEELDPYPKVMDQIDFRKTAVETWLKEQGLTLADIDLFCVRGGLVKPIPSGIYRVTNAMIEELKAETYGSHVSNTGMAIGYRWGQETGKEVIFLNAPVTDELSDLARLTGLKGVYRRTIFHALNQKQIALEYAKSIGKPLSELKLIVCHLGGGITVGAHDRGRIVDVNNAIDGEGPFSPERSGALSARMTLELLDQCGGDRAKLNKLLVGKGGMISHLGTSDVKAIVEQAESDPNVRLILDAMIYQIAKETGAMATVLLGQVDQILVTGGLAYNPVICAKLKARIAWIAPVTVYPGEDEMEALASGALRYLRHEEALQPY